MTTRGTDTGQMTTRVGCVRDKDNVTQNKNRKRKLRKIKIKKNQRYRDECNR